MHRRRLRSEFHLACSSCLFAASVCAVQRRHLVVIRCSRMATAHALVPNAAL